MSHYGPVWPLKEGSEGAFALYDNAEEQINFYLKNLLLTSKGENMSDPGYGIGIRQYLFEQNLGKTTGDMKYEIESQINNYLPYLTIIEVQTSASDLDIDSGILNIRIKYRLPGSKTNILFELESNSQPTTRLY